MLLVRGLPLAVVLLAVCGVTGCKRQKPPPRTRIWMGLTHACAMQKSGEVECWGRNDKGQLGDGTLETRLRPAAVALSSVDTAHAAELALGLRHTCLLPPAGAARPGVRCWGDDERGQIGKGLEALTGVTTIRASGDQTCALSDAIRCWGNDRGVHEVAGLAGRATALSMGDGFVCGALADPKVVRCSGTDERGESAGNKPVLVGAAVTMLTSGSKHTCALLDDGAIQCWGKNDQGQLGNGTTVDAPAPAIVHGLPPAVEVKAGSIHTCARLRTNTVACWGDNHAHQLANGTRESSSRPAPVNGLVGVQELAAGGESTCARLTEGHVRCWGNNAFGQLGDGTTTEHDVPMPVKSPLPAAAK